MGLLVSFGDVRRGSVLPDLSDRFVSRLFSTYISYLPQGMLAYELERRSDPRGVLAEFIKSPAVGQVFVSRTRPGISRGDHYHQTKVEKFLVLGGTAVIRLRNVKSGETDEYCVNGHDLVVVDIPPGWTHNIENIGNEDLIVLFWASEVFDPVLPDTFPERVLGWPVDGVATRDDET
jgi:UDP-2-acetamido-2,6-beta-L-arabino-hexul-4-ose reductase